MRENTAPIDLEKLTELAKSATPGPWGSGSGYVIREDRVYDAIAHCEWNEKDDSAYIAAANPEVVLSLISEIRAARELLDKSRDIAEGIFDGYPTEERHFEPAREFLAALSEYEKLIDHK